MGKPKVLLLGEIEHAHDTWNELSSIAELTTAQCKDRADFLAQAKSGDYDGVVAVYRTFASVALTGNWDEELISALPKSLQFCSHNGAGYDQIDVQACSARDPPIRVSNVPTAVDDATADTAVFLMLGALRGFNSTMLALRDGKWRGQSNPPLGHDPEGKVLGILGMGGIGRNMKKKCDAFGMKTIYHNRKQLSSDAVGGARYVTFDDLLAQSDVLSLNLPLNVSHALFFLFSPTKPLILAPQKNTRHIIGAPELKKMKKGAVIVNTARGAVIDEAALVDALKSGQIWSAGLDVYEAEPKIHPGLIDNPHVMLLPHMGTWTVETQTSMEKWNIGNVRLAIETGKLKSPVLEQADL